MNDIYYIRLDKIECQLRVGVFDHEKINPQLVLVNVECAAKQPHDINIDTVARYDTIYYIVKEWEKRPHTELLETIAANIVSEIMTDHLIINCTISMSKPHIFGGNAIPSIIWRAGKFH